MQNASTDPPWPILLEIELYAIRNLKGLWHILDQQYSTFLCNFQIHSPLPSNFPFY